MTTQVLRRPTFSLRKALSPITNFFVRIFDAFIEARRLQAAMETAHHLKAHNADFKDMSYHEVVQFILEDTVIKTK